MKISTKATLLSALVYPGAGHFILKKYYLCAMLMAAASIALYILISNAVSKAMLITNDILSGKVPADITVIRELVTKQQTAEDALLVSIATTVLIIVWLISVIDSFRVGRSRDADTAVRVRAFED